MKIGIPSRGKTDKEMPSCPILGIEKHPNAIIGVTRIGGMVIMDIYHDDLMNYKDRVCSKVFVQSIGYAFPDEVERRKSIIDALYKEMIIRFSDVSDQLTGESLQNPENLRKFAQMLYFAVHGND